MANTTDIGSFEKIIYIDYTNGDDVNDGTSRLPVKTYKRATALYSNSSTLIIFMPGTHYVGELEKDMFNAYEGKTILQLQNNVTMTSLEPDNTTIILSDKNNSMNRTHWLQLWYSDSKIINCNFILRSTKGRTGYGNSIFLSCRGAIHNCTFKLEGTGFSYVYDNDKPQVNVVFNSIFYSSDGHNPSMTSSYSGNVGFYNCVFKNPEGSYSRYVNCLQSFKNEYLAGNTVDLIDKGKLLDGTVTNIGLYGGYYNRETFTIFPCIYVKDGDFYYSNTDEPVIYDTLSRLKFMNTNGFIDVSKIKNPTFNIIALRKEKQ